PGRRHAAVHAGELLHEQLGRLRSRADLVRVDRRPRSAVRDRVPGLRQRRLRPQHIAAPDPHDRLRDQARREHVHGGGGGYGGEQGGAGGRDRRPRRVLPASVGRGFRSGSFGPRAVSQRTTTTPTTTTCRTWSWSLSWSLSAVGIRPFPRDLFLYSPRT